MKKESSPKLFIQKATSLEVANQMYKDAWLVKRTLFRKNFPELTDGQIDKKTRDYFLNLKKDD